MWTYEWRLSEQYPWSRISKVWDSHVQAANHAAKLLSFYAEDGMAGIQVRLTRIHLEAK